MRARICYGSKCWSVSDYAAKLGMSATHLNRIARSMTGQSALQFINGMLFQEARSLLAYTRIDIAEIGYKLGFDDPSYFSRAFKRIIGVSPKNTVTNWIGNGISGWQGVDFKT